MRNIKIVMEYDGTNYSGWQKQKNALSIEEVVTSAARQILKEDITLTGSSRTDAGVHARGQVANFFTNSPIPVEKLPLAINTKLPEDIRVISALEAAGDFHARYSSRGKRYSYTILNRRIAPAIMRNYVMHCSYEIDFLKMQQASKYFLGTHDFTAFKSTGSSVKTSVRTITNIELIRNKDIITLNIGADGFLYNMVRIIAGTLVDVGKGKINPNSVPDIIRSMNRERAGQTAPSGGLCLEEVYY